MTGAIRIVVADDQVIGRRGLAMLLAMEGGFVVVAEAASQREAVDACRRYRPAVLVMSIQLPAASGPGSVTEAIRRVSPATRILAIAERGEGRCMVLNPPRPGEPWDPAKPAACHPVTDCLQLAVQGGVHGTIRRDADPDDLFRAVHALASGQTWLDPATASRLEGAQGPDEGVARLTARELQVGALIAEGRANKEIARALKIGEPTIKKHVGRILAKLGLQDRLQAGLFLARNPMVLAASSGARRQRSRTIRRVKARPSTSTRAR